VIFLGSARKAEEFGLAHDKIIISCKLSGVQGLIHTYRDLASQCPGVESMSVAVMGCVVNGPGESKHANIGISLPGTGEKPVAPVYEDGEKTVTLKGDNIAEEFQVLVNNYVARTYKTA